HAVYDGQRLQLEAEISYDPPAGLESFLDGDPDAFYSGAGRLDDLDQPLERTTVCQEIIDDQDMVVRREKLLRYDHMIDALMCERFDLRHIHLAVQVDALGFLGEYNRNIEMLGRHAGD